MKGKSGTSRQTQKERLIEELEALLPVLDEEGLIFLLKQANVIRHNLEVEKINREIVRLEQKRSEQRQSEGEATEQRGGRSTKARVDVEESDDRKTFYLTMTGARKVLTLDEMRALVQACHIPKTKANALNRLYRWLSEERRDILADCGIKSSRNPLLEELYVLLRSRYKPMDS
jgi:hypothetical protein